MATMVQEAEKTELTFEFSEQDYFQSYAGESDTHHYHVVQPHGEQEYTAKCIDKKTNECVSENFPFLAYALQYCHTQHSLKGCSQ